MNNELKNKYEGLQDKYLNKEVLSYDYKEIKKMMGFSPEELKLQLDYNSLSEKQLTYVNDFIKIVKAYPNNPKKVFKYIKEEYFDKNELTLEDFRATFVYWFVEVPRANLATFSSCYKRFVEKTVEQYRLHEIIDANEKIIQQELEKVETHYNKINRKLYTKDGCKKFDYYYNKEVKLLNALNTRSMSGQAATAITANFVKEINSVHTIKEIKRRKRITLTASVAVCVIIVAVVIIGFIPKTTYTTASYYQINNKINEMQYDLNN